MHAHEEPQPAPAGALEALVEAERVWRTNLEAARAEAAAMVTAARAEAAGRDAAAARELAPIVERRRRELAEQLAARVAAIVADGRADADRFAAVPPERITALAQAMLERAPWLSGEAHAETAR